MPTITRLQPSLLDGNGVPMNRLVANYITQASYGRDGRCHVDYEAVRQCMREIDAEAQARGVETVAMPAIGAGLGGGNWSVIEGIIRTEPRSVRAVVYLLDGKLP